jgi:hypothetical protein
MYRKTYILFLLAFFIMGLPAPISAAEENRFVTVSDKGVYQVFLSPNFAEDKTAFAFVDQFPVPASASRRYFNFLRSTDGGVTWQEIPWLIENSSWGDEFYPIDLDFTNDGRILLTGYRKANPWTWLCISEDGGDRWTIPKYLFPESFSLYYTEPFENRLYGLFFPTWSNNLRFSDDWGTTWDGNVLYSNLSMDKNSMAVLDEKTMFILSSDTQLVVTRDGGQKWTPVSIKLTYEFLDPVSNFPRIKLVKEADGGATIVAVGPGAAAQMYISRDKGYTWKKIDESKFKWRGPDVAVSRIREVGLVPGGTIFVGTADNCMMVSDDYGENWRPINDGLSEMLRINDIQCTTVGDKIVVFLAGGNRIYRMDYHKPQASDQVEAQVSDQVEAPPPNLVRFTIGQDTYESNGQTVKMDAKTFSSSGRTYVPVRYLAQAFDASAEWDNTAHKAVLAKEGIRVEIYMDSRTILVNGKPREMDVLPENVDGRVYLPLKFAAEAFGYQAEWDPSTQTATIVQGPVSPGQAP